jgi:hypothetical protein
MHEQYNIGRVFSRTIVQLKSNFWTLLGYLIVSSILASMLQRVISIPMNIWLQTSIVQSSALRVHGHIDAMLRALFMNPGVWIVLLVSMILSLAGQSIVQGGCFYAILGTNDGQRARFGDCFTVAFKKCVPFFLATLIIVFATLLGYMLLIIPGIILALMWSVAMPALIAENLDAKTSLARSQQLTQGLKGQIFLTHLVLFFAMMLVIAVIAGIFFLIFGSSVLALSHGHIHAVSSGAAITMILGMFVLILLMIPVILLLQMFAFSFCVSIYRETLLVKEGSEDQGLVRIFQ